MGGEGWEDGTVKERKKKKERSERMGRYEYEGRNE